jgi:hypothetical protein
MDPMKAIVRSLVLVMLSCCISVAADAQQTTTTGWMMYSDTVGRSLELTPDQEERLRDWNARYQMEYDRMPPDGADHTPLQQRRERELQSILTPDQYRRWNELDHTREGLGTQTTGGAPGPEMRRGEPTGTHRGIMDRGDGAGAGKDRGTGTELGRGTGTSIDRGAGVGHGGTGTTGTGSATDGGNRNTVTPPTP